MSKHYIRLDANLNIILGYSEALQQITGISFLETDICICEDGERQFQMNGIYNPSLRDDCGCYFYKWIDGEVYIKTKEELDYEHSLIPAPPLSDIELIKLAQEEERANQGVVIRCLSKMIEIQDAKIKALEGGV